MLKQFQLRSTKEKLHFFVCFRTGNYTTFTVSLFRPVLFFFIGLLLFQLLSDLFIYVKDKRRRRKGGAEGSIFILF